MASHRMLLKAALLSLIALFTGIEPTHADSNSNGVSLEEVKDYALAHSILATQIDATLAHKLSEAYQNTLPLDPEFSAEVKVPTARKDEDTQIEVSLGLPLKPSSPSLRVDVQRQLSLIATQQQRLELLELQRTVTELFSRIWALQEKENAFSRASTRLASSKQKIKHATSQGLLFGGEEKFLDAQISAIQATSLEIQVERATLNAELARTSGYILGVKDLELPTFPNIPSRAEFLKRLESAQHGIRQRSELLKRGADSQLALAKAEAWPVLVPRLVYEHADSGSERVGVGISLPLPFSNRNQAEIEKRNAEQRIAQAELNYASGETLKTEVDNLFLACKLSVEQAEIYRSQILPNLSEALLMQEKQFLGGQGSILQIWQTERELLGAELTWIELQHKSLINRFKLWAILGEEV